MTAQIKLTIIVLVILIGFSTFACSKNKSPVEPAVGNLIENNQMPFSVDEIDSNRGMMAAYDCVIDPIAKTFTVELINRSADYHYPLTQLYPNVLRIISYGFTPNFWADIKLVHPLPGSGISGFDARVVAVFPANPAVSMNYPVMNVIANNSILLEPDGYTKLFDSLAPGISGTANPFIAYFKDQPNRIWSSTGITEETKRWQMDLSGFGGPLSYKLVVDVATNFPNPPQSGADNAPEPVWLEAVVGEGLLSTGGSADVTVTLLDWQGAGGNEVYVEAPDLFSGTVALTFLGAGLNPNEWKFFGTINNVLLAPAGDYDLLIGAKDTQSGVYIYDEFSASVVFEIDFDPVEVTPPRLNFSSKDIVVDGNYLYVAGDANGFHIFNISDVENPIWLTKIDIPGNALGVSVTGGIACVIDQFQLHLIDVSVPLSASIINSVDVADYATSVFVSGDYAYVTSDSNFFEIIDINPPESANVVKVLETPGSAMDVHVLDGYAYVVSWDESLQIVDVDPPETASVVHSIELSPWMATAVFAENGYAYVLEFGRIYIVDISTPETAWLVNSLPVGSGLGFFPGICVSSGYAYVGTDDDTGLNIVDIDPPESAYVVNSVATPRFANSVSVSGNYAFVANDQAGIEIIDITLPETAFIENSIQTTGQILDVVISGDYAYLADEYGGLQIYDITSPESPQFVNLVPNTGKAQELFILGGYAYLADEHAGLQIIDISVPESAFLVNTVDTPGRAYDVFVIGNYAYVADGSNGLQIIDISIPESAFIFKTVDTPGSASGIDVDGVFAYIADGFSGGLQVIDISDPENAAIQKAVVFFGAEDVTVSNGYAYVADGMAGVQIIDVDPLPSASIVNTVDTPNTAMDIVLWDDYAFVADGFSGIQIIYNDPPESAFVAEGADTPDFATGIWISGSYAYVADSSAGLRIISLW